MPHFPDDFRRKIFLALYLLSSQINWKKVTYLYFISIHQKFLYLKIKKSFLNEMENF